MPTSFKIFLHFFLIFFIISGFFYMDSFLIFSKVIKQRKIQLSTALCLFVCLFVQVLLDITLCRWVCVSRLFEEEFCVDSSIVRDEALRVFNTPGITNPTTQCNITKDLNYHEQSGSISHLPFSYPVKFSMSSYYTGRFTMFSVVIDTYNKKTKGHTLMELFTATGKLKKFF